jgi:hypothetical protein
MNRTTYNIKRREYVYNNQNILGVNYSHRPYLTVAGKLDQ